MYVHNVIHKNSFIAHVSLLYQIFTIGMLFIFVSQITYPVRSQPNIGGYKFYSSKVFYSLKFFVWYFINSCFMENKSEKMRELLKCDIVNRISLNKLIT